MKATGYGAIEMSQVPMSPDNVRDMGRAQAELGIKIVALSAMLTTLPGVASDSLTDDFDKIVSDCKTLDTAILRIGMLPFDAMRSLDTVIDFARKADCSHASSGTKESNSTTTTITSSLRGSTADTCSTSSLRTPRR